MIRMIALKGAYRRCPFPMGIPASLYSFFNDAAGEYGHRLDIRDPAVLFGDMSFPAIVPMAGNEAIWHRNRLGPVGCAMDGGKNGSERHGLDKMVVQVR